MNHDLHSGDDELRAWSNRTVVDTDGRVAICFGLAATLYFRDGHVEKQRRAVLDCFNDYESVAGNHLTWHGVGARSGRMSRVDALRSRDMSPYLLSEKWTEPAAHEHAWAFNWHGGVNRDDASPWRIYAYGSPRRYAELDGSLSFLQVSVPLGGPTDAYRRFAQLVFRFCERLSPLHGYGGATLLISHDRGLAQVHASEAAGFAARYPGLEIDRPMSHKLATLNAIKGAGWITVLSQAFVERMGGLQGLRDRLAETVSVTPFATGVLLVAGNAPEVGDLNRRLDTPHLRDLSRALKPIRITEHPALYTEGRFAEASEYSAWLARFDGQ